MRLDPGTGRDALPLARGWPFGKPLLPTLDLGFPKEPWGAWDEVIPKTHPSADSGGGGGLLVVPVEAGSGE